MDHALKLRRLALGAAQFGLNYGIANGSGQVPRAVLGEILDHAARAGLDTIDTAIAYGDSEERLGEMGVDRWRVISKLPRLPAQVPANVDAWVRAHVQESLTRLQIPCLSALLLHHPLDLLGSHGPALTRALGDLRQQGMVRKTGISIYDPAELDTFWQHEVVELVQAPLNILDRRLLRSGWLDRLHAGGIEVHVRSVFMQGLLLMPSSGRPPQFRKWQVLWDRWESWLEQNHLTALQACLRYVLDIEAVDRVVVGVDNLAQLREILAACDGPLPGLPDDLSSQSPDLINPSQWQRP